MTEPVILPFDAKAFLEKCIKNKTFPGNDFLKQAVFRYILHSFEDGHVYTEQEVHGTLSEFFEDYTLMRRELINFNYMWRNPETGEYWVTKRNVTLDEVRNNTLLASYARSYGILDDRKK